MSHVLVVDDDPTTRALLVDTFVLCGLPVRAVSDGPTALRAVLAEPPKCVVLDVMMPGMSGYDVLAALRADPETARLPVAMLTASTDDDSTWRGWRLGADAYLPNPFDPDDVVRWVERLTGGLPLSPRAVLDELSLLVADMA